jgi:lipoyl(octanoyl) transferase
MALDAALLESVAAGSAPVFRLYQWSPACLSLGRNQTARGVYTAAGLAGEGVDLVRRPTGGLAVLHDAELTYAVAAPVALLGGPREAYHRIHAALAAGLATLGVPATIAGSGPGIRDRGVAALPCFDSPAGGEVVVGGRKLVGSAQRYERRTLLQHGSILIRGGQDRVAFLRDPDVPMHRAGSTAAPTSLADVLGEVPDVTELVDAVLQGFRLIAGDRLDPEPPSPQERDLAARLETHYRDDAWTWRR